MHCISLRESANFVMQVWCASFCMCMYMCVCVCVCVCVKSGVTMTGGLTEVCWLNNAAMMYLSFRVRGVWLRLWASVYGCGQVCGQCAPNILTHEFRLHRLVTPTGDVVAQHTMCEIWRFTPLTVFVQLNMVVTRVHQASNIVSNPPPSTVHSCPSPRRPRLLPAPGYTRCCAHLHFWCATVHPDNYAMHLFIAPIKGSVWCSLNTTTCLRSATLRRVFPVSTWGFGAKRVDRPREPLNTFLADSNISGALVFRPARYVISGAQWGMIEGAGV